MFKKLFGLGGEKPLSKADYSFGLQESITIKSSLDKKDYKQVEDFMSKLDSDSISHVVDHLALTTKESDLVNWLEADQESEAANLVLGVFYAHKGWTIRGHSRGSEVSDGSAMSFQDFELKAEEFMEAIAEHQLYKTEADCRLIRISMSLGDDEKVVDNFNNCVASDPLKVWAYIHYLEAIEPKWGGSREQIAELFNILPDSKLISQIVNLKILNDSIVWEEYWGVGEDVNVIEETKRQLRSTDSELTSSPHQSILRFIIYNYMYSLAKAAGEKDLRDKYLRKMDNHYTLYPFGIQ